MAAIDSVDAARLANIKRDNEDGWRQLRALVMRHDPRLLAFIEHARRVEDEQFDLVQEMLLVRGHVQRLRDENNGAVFKLREAEKVLEERERLVGDLKLARDANDPRLVDRAVTAAREDERARLAGELQVLRNENALLRSENESLRATKRKLREAIERYREGR